VGVVGLFAEPNHIDPALGTPTWAVAEMAANEIPREAGAAERATAAERQR
jgi:hypothetical protein